MAPQNDDRQHNNGVHLDEADKKCETKIIHVYVIILYIAMLHHIELQTKIQQSRDYTSDMEIGEQKT